MRSRLIFLVCVVGSLCSIAQADAADPHRLGFVGTYTRGESEGIYRIKFNVETGEIKLLGVAAKAVHPSFLALHPRRPLLFAVNETGDFQGLKSGAVSAFQVDAKTGKLKLINQQPSRGGAPCHLVVDGAGENVLVANYSGGNVVSLPIQKDGRLAPASAFVQHKGSSVTARQKSPHAHSINLDPAGRFAVVADLGLDKILVYRFDSKRGSLVANNPPSVSVASGSGPRHFAFHPNSKFAYVINKLALTVSAFKYDASAGVLSPIQTISTIPKGAKRRGSTADLQVHASGKFVYGSNRGHDSIVVFGVDERTGRLTRVENESTQGRTPRNFAIDPTGKFLLAENQSTNSIVVFRIDQKTGELTPTGHKVTVPSPVCIKFLP